MSDISILNLEVMVPQAMIILCSYYKTWSPRYGLAMGTVNLAENTIFYGKLLLQWPQQCFFVHTRHRLVHILDILSLNPFPL